VIHDAYSDAQQPTDEAAGGTIEAGTYFMTAFTYYEGNGPNAKDGTHQDTMVIDTAASVMVIVEATTSTGHANGGATGYSYEASMGVLDLQATCGAEDLMVTDIYTAEGGTLTMYSLFDHSVSVWKKQ